ncbi:MAG: alkylmercury lyase family protein [Candidatus Hermodarchaeota archaeon]
MSQLTDFDSLVHHTILKHIIDYGYDPDVLKLSQLLNSSEKIVKDSLDRLVDNHGIVLHPNSYDIWVVHPFALWPTLFWVTSNRGSWWGNCAWCSLGIAALLKEDTEISTRIGGHDEPIEINVVNGEILESDLVVHFSIPVKHAWDNVFYYCGTVLVFRSEDQVDQWCEAHRKNKGVVIPIKTTWELAKKWYGNHLAPDWKKWTVKEAQEIFTSMNLTIPSSNLLF